MKGQRKLGSNPRPKSILAHQGDSSRGEKLFWSEAVNCGKCHRVGDRGTPVGPDLSTIGTLRSPEDLLESLLSPSRRIEPKFAAYLALTEDGRSIDRRAGQARRACRRAARRSRKGNHAGGQRTCRNCNPSRTSLMPDGQMASLTAQEAADLLEYLATRKNGPAIPSH